MQSSKDYKQKILDEKVIELNSGLLNCLLSKSLDLNCMAFEKLFTDDDTIVIKKFSNKYNGDIKYGMYFVQALVDSDIINKNIIKPLMTEEIPDNGEISEILMENVILIDDIKKVNNFKEIVEAVTYGNTLLFVSGSDEAFILDTKKFNLRSITEPESDRILKGPREGFTESIMVNLSLMHRKIRSNDLKMKFASFGRRSNTSVCVCYIDSIVNKKILKELFIRLEKIDIDAVLDANYLAETIKDFPTSPFRTIGTSERPDVIAAKVLEGRIAIFVDGTPVVLTLPYLFLENFQSPEDYYVNFYYASFSRLLRILSFFLTIATPALYVAAAAYQHELFPTPLLINFAIERQSVPLPAALEAFILIIIFDILKETGIRMPSNIGQALSIVGALVIGQAAVQAKLVAAPMIIVIALTGITGLLIPKLNAPMIYSRFLLLLLATVLGIFGFITGLCIVLILILNTRSFGISQLTPMASLKYQDLKDTVTRAPWWLMKNRPKIIANDKVRLKIQGGQ